jgi:hypothetical protein
MYLHYSKSTPESQRPKAHPKYIFRLFIGGISREAPTPGHVLPRVFWTCNPCKV